MPRNLDALTERPYDVLVIGGGIHGLFVAYDAALRGLQVALIDRGDFGAGVSANHQRTIHGGLRELERGRWLKARRQIAERRTWAQIAPHLLRPLPFLIGTYRFSRRSRLVVRAGFKAYDIVGRSRNRDVSPELHLPRAKLESAAATRRLFPGIAEAGLSGGAVWYDYQVTFPERLTWTVALGAREAGATLHNYVEATAPVMEGGRVAGATVRDVQSEATFDVRAKVTILATGGQLASTMGAFGVSRSPAMLRAMNLLIDRPARDIATAARSPSGRTLTAVPWAGYVLVGTGQSAAPVDSDQSTPPEEAIEAFLSEANATFPTLEAMRADVRLVHHGLTPAVQRGGGSDLMPESSVSTGPGGLVSIVGVKLTTSRVTAARAVDLACQQGAGHAGRSRTGDRPLPHAGVADVEGRLIETLRDLGVSLDRPTIKHLAGWYGTEASDVVTFAAQEGLLALIDSTPMLEGEIAYAAEHADAIRLDDAVRRRTPLGTAGHPGEAPLAQAAAVMGTPSRLVG